MSIKLVGMGERRREMKTIAKEFKKMKFVDYDNLDSFESVAIAVTLFLSVSYGVILGGTAF